MSRAEALKAIADFQRALPMPIPEAASHCFDWLTQGLEQLNPAIVPESWL
jgi:hypothetical protein